MTPASSLIDEPVHIRVSGLRGHAVATVGLRATDAGGRLWHSSARFRAGARGTVDLDRAAPISGSYEGAWGMGLIASMTTRASPSDFYRFSWGEKRHTFRIAVRVGKTTRATKSFRRGLWPRPAVEQLHTVEDGGFYGRYYAPSGGQAPGVLIFGGSDGGLSVAPTAALLAEHGYATLALAYFKAPGLPPTLSSIPLEYFARALAWLRAQPQVAPARVTVVGISRGSEAAQLLGTHYPGLVNAVVASVPSNVALCAYPPGSGSSWTFEGRPVPCTDEFNNPAPTDDPGAVIPDEQVRGPLFLVCGGLDSIWISCPYARAIMARLRSFHHPYPDVLYAFPRAGHGVGSLVPYQPIAPAVLNIPANERGHQKVWPRLLAFLSLGRRG